MLLGVEEFAAADIEPPEEVRLTRAVVQHFYTCMLATSGCTTYV
jgi:hypothetical protein